MNPLGVIISFANLLREGEEAVRLIQDRRNRLTHQENHNWNITCIGIMTIATVIMVGLFGSVQLASIERSAGSPSASEKSDANSSTTAQTVRESTPNGLALDTVDNPCPNDALEANRDGNDAGTLVDGSVRWLYDFIPTLINALAVWAIAAYLGCMLLSLQTIFTESPTRRAKIDSARFSGLMLLIEGGFVGIMVIFTTILTHFGQAP